MFDTCWGFAPHATLLPLNRLSLFHDEFDTEVDTIACEPITEKNSENDYSELVNILRCY